MRRSSATSASSSTTMMRALWAASISRLLERQRRHREQQPEARARRAFDRELAVALPPEAAGPPPALGRVGSRSERGRQADAVVGDAELEPVVAAPRQRDRDAAPALAGERVLVGVGDQLVEDQAERDR